MSDQRFESAIALLHQRYSTNTLPKWRLAHPYRFICHNGEINTLRGNLNNMRSREPHLASPLFGADVKKLTPILTEGASDSANFDGAFELVARGGRGLAHAIGMMIPEPWSGHESMPDDLKAFYEYHATIMEPWDGPAAVAFSDGIQVGAVLDRIGLRPSRYWLTNDTLIRACYRILGLQSYFTAGEKEVRAWTIHVGDTAPKAAGVIHTDFEKGFIRAEVIAYDDFIACKGEHGAKLAGKMRLEGKEYVVKDGDVMHFRFNV